MFDSIRKFKQGREEKKQQQQEWEELSEEYIGSEINNNEKLILENQTKKIIEEMQVQGIDAETIKSYKFIWDGLMNGFFTECLASGMRKTKGYERLYLNRAKLLFNLFKPLMDILVAMEKGKIKANFKLVQKELPLLFQRAASKKELKFWSSVNELNNIATGKISLQ